MAAYHLGCWETKFQKKTARKFPASKFSSACAICGSAIRIGDMMTFSRRGAPNANGTPREESENDLEASEPEATPVPEAPKATPRPMGGIIGFDAEALADALVPHLEGKLAAKDNGIRVNVTEITIKRVETDQIESLGLQHKCFAELLAVAQSRCHAWVAGPAGSGKTSGAEAVAKALDLPFYMTGSIFDAIQLLGYKDAGGTYHPTAFRQAFEHGGVFLCDDFDGSDPQVAVATLMAALANGVCAFPDGMVKRHEDCIIIVSANTWGHGATHEYVGRVKQDAAFLDRFVRVEWPYDADLEIATAPNIEWAKRVQAIRAAVVAKGLRVLVTPRATYNGAKLLAAGLPQDKVEAMTIASAMTPDQWASVKAAAA